MLLSIVRNLRSRSLRTALTVAGIAIGILALVLVGSLAERLQTIVGRATSLNSNSIFAFASGRELIADDAAARMARAFATVRRLAGVKDVIPEVLVPSGSSIDDGRFGPPAFIFGFPYDSRRTAAGVLTIERGRDFGRPERRVALVGADYASAHHVRPGDVIALYGSSFTVVGALAKSFTVFDAGTIVPLADARNLLAQLVPPTIRRIPKVGATALLVIAEPGADTALIAHRITVLTNLQARDPAEIAGDVRSTTRIFDAIIFGAALIALIVGSFSIVNTMTTAVLERTREIGIRKAIGASDRDILLEFLSESAVIGALGGFIGLVTGVGVVAFLNARNAATGSLELFAVTPRLAFGAVLFAVLLSVIAGVLPAVQAARLDPVRALRRIA